MQTKLRLTRVNRGEHVTPANKFLTPGTIVWRQVEVTSKPDHTGNNVRFAPIDIDVAPEPSDGDRRKQPALHINLIPNMGKIWEPTIGLSAKGIVGLIDNPNCPDWCFAAITAQTMKFKDSGMGAVRVKLHNSVDIAEYLEWRKMYASAWDEAWRTQASFEDRLLIAATGDLDVETFGMRRLMCQFSHFEVSPEIGKPIAYYQSFDLAHEKERLERLDREVKESEAADEQAERELDEEKEAEFQAREVLAQKEEVGKK